MDKTKVIDVAEHLGSGSLGSIFWQWQSGPNPDPWAEKDPAKRTWQNYSDDESRIIEEAFLLKKEVADLGNYEVDFKKMLQVNKQFRNRIRRVRKQEKSRFMIEMSEPVALVKNEKTINEAFGTIQHFLEYIMKRTPEAYGLYQRLKTLGLDSQSSQFEDIIKEVITCIGKGAEVLKARSGSQTKSFINQTKEVVNFIEGNSATFGDFLKAILRVYTKETFICYWLNELLQSQNWEKVNILTPYLVCLVYTFKLSGYVLKYQEPQRSLNNLVGIIVKPKLYLFKGTALEKGHLELYDPKKIKYFSWNGVTSTSRDRNIAQNFIRLSLAKSKQLDKPKMGVLFNIETDFSSSEDCEGMIDVSEISKSPKEQEIILAPGTVFKLLETRLIENDIYEINLKATKKFENRKENIDLLRALQDQAISKDKAVIDGLPSQQSFRLLELLKGNKLISRLEIRNSGIEDLIMEEIENLRLTMNVKIEDVKLIDNTIVIEDLTPFAPYLSLDNMNKIVASNKIRFKERNSKGSLKNKGFEGTTLILSEECLKKFRQNNQLKELSEKIASANQIASLDLSVRKMDGSNCEWTEFLLQCINGIKDLQSLGLKINKEYCVTRKTLEVLCERIGALKNMNRLSLGLSLSEGELEFFKKILESILWIQSLSLDLKFDNKILDEGLGHLKSGLLPLSSLHHLSLDFSFCNKISDEGLDHLKSGLLPLSSLHHLSLNFYACNKISDEGFGHLKSGLLPLSFLHHLSLNFSGCDKISDGGLGHLKSGLLSLSSLHHLSLDFSWCKQISDEGFGHLKSGLLSLSSLQHLSLNFSGCDKISDGGLGHLKSGLVSLSSLQHLYLNFSWCKQISDEGLDHLKSGLLSLSPLHYLSLDFSWCKQISDEGLGHLKSGLLPLSSLHHLSLNFSYCNLISDEGLDHLKSYLLPLSSLHHLSLNFSGCNKISDGGLGHLKSGLVSLSSLKHLSLNFSGCDKISDGGLGHLKSDLLSLSSLQHSSLDFSGCNKISDEGLNHLKSGLLPLSSFQHFSLDSRYRDKISDEGLIHLKDGLCLPPSYSRVAKKDQSEEVEEKGTLVDRRKCNQAYKWLKRKINKLLLSRRVSREIQFANFKIDRDCISLLLKYDHDEPPMLDFPREKINEGAEQLLGTHFFQLNFNCDQISLKELEMLVSFLAGSSRLSDLFVHCQAGKPPPSSVSLHKLSFFLDKTLETFESFPSLNTQIIGFEVAELLRYKISTFNFCLNSKDSILQLKSSFNSLCSGGETEHFPNISWIHKSFLDTIFFSSIPQAFNSSWVSLIQLDISHSQINDEDMRVLAESQSLINLRELNLSYNNIGEEGVRAFASSSLRNHLQYVNFSANPISETGRQALEESQGLIIASTELDLNRNNNEEIRRREPIENVAQINHISVIFYENKITEESTKKVSEQERSQETSVESAELDGEIYSELRKKSNLITEEESSSNLNPVVSFYHTPENSRN